MKTFLKENFALVVGISLPILLIVFFFIASRAPQELVPDPKYSVIFAANYNVNWTGRPWVIEVKNNKIRIRHKETENRGYSKPQIYIFNHQTLKANLVDIDFDNIVDGVVSDHQLDLLNKNKFITNAQSPDGYRLEYHYGHSGRGLIGELFAYRSRHRNRYALIKDSRVIPLKAQHNIYQAHFIAWIDHEQ